MDFLVEDDGHLALAEILGEVGEGRLAVLLEFESNCRKAVLVLAPAHEFEVGAGEFPGGGGADIDRANGVLHTNWNCGEVRGHTNAAAAAGLLGQDAFRKLEPENALARPVGGSGSAIEGGRAFTRMGKGPIPVLVDLALNVEVVFLRRDDAELQGPDVLDDSLDGPDFLRGHVGQLNHQLGFTLRVDGNVGEPAPVQALLEDAGGLFEHRGRVFLGRDLAFLDRFLEVESVDDSRTSTEVEPEVDVETQNGPDREGAEGQHPENLPTQIGNHRWEPCGLELGGLAGPVTKEEEAGAAGFLVGPPANRDIHHLGAVNGKGPFHSFALDDAAHRESSANPVARILDDLADEGLNPVILAFMDEVFDLDEVAHLEGGEVLLHVSLVEFLDDFVHDWVPRVGRFSRCRAGCRVGA